MTEAHRILESAIAEYRPVKRYVLVSGGRDSTLAAHLAKTSKIILDGIVHINTGIGIPETRDYVYSFAAWLGLPLIEAIPPQSYDDIVLRYGFPGPAAHRLMYARLKERPLRLIRREAQDGGRGRVMFITGVRKAESIRRMGYVKPVTRQGSTVWVAPALDFSNQDVTLYHRANQIPPNPVVANLHMSGECLCGSFAGPGELDQLAFFYPAVAARIRNLERQCFEKGLPFNWGRKPSRRVLAAQGHLPLCGKCPTRWDISDGLPEHGFTQRRRA